MFAIVAYPGGECNGGCGGFPEAEAKTSTAIRFSTESGWWDRLYFSQREPRKGCDNLDVKTKVEDRTLTVSLTGELDHHGARGLMDQMDRLMEQNLPSKTILDLEGLSFMDSSGIAVILRAKRRMEALGGNLIVVNIPKQAARVLETAGLARYVKLI